MKSFSCIHANDGDLVLVRLMPTPPFWMVPPDPALPVPSTDRLPLAPVLLSTMPLVAPLDEMLLNFRPLAPMVVFATLSAVAVVVVRVLVVSVAVTVPPPVAVKAGLAPVDTVSAPVKLIVAPVLLVSEMPLTGVADRAREAHGVAGPAGHHHGVAATCW